MTAAYRLPKCQLLSSTVHQKWSRHLICAKHYILSDDVNEKLLHFNKAWIIMHLFRKLKSNIGDVHL